MATDLERLVVQLSADIKGYERALNRARGVTAQNTRAIQGQFSKMNRSVSAEFMSLGKTATAVFAAISTARGMKNFSDAATRIDNALKVAGLSGDELEKVYKRLFESAQKNAAPIESLVTLYGRAAAVQKELGVTSEELLRFTDNVSVALRVAGVDAQSASGALLQLSQALGSSRVQAEEFNSINEGARPILQAVAAGIKEAGGSVSKLKQLVNDGKISNQAFFRGFEAGSVTLQSRVAGAVLTVDQAYGNLETSLIDVFREFNKATGAGEKFAGGINAVALAIGRLDVTGLIEKLQRAKKAFDDAAESFGNSQVFKDLNEALGVTKDGALVNPDVEAARVKVAGLEREVELLQATIAKNTNLGFDNTEALARIRSVRAELANLQAAAANMPATVTGLNLDGTAADTSMTNGLMGGSTIRGGTRRPAPVSGVSLGDYPVLGSKTGGGSKKVNEFDAAVKSANEATQSLQRHEAALRVLTGTETDYATKVAAVEKAQDLLSAAQEGGKAVGKELSDVNQLLSGDLSKLSPEAQKQALAIRNLSLSYADATTKLDKLKESQDKAAESAREAIDFQKDLVNGALSDMRTALEDGKLTWEDLGNVAVNVLNKIADRLQTMLVDQLFSKGLGGLFGSLGGSVVGGLSGVGGGGVGASAAAAAPVAKMASAPSLPSMSKMAGAGQQVHVTVGLIKNGLNIEPEVVDVASRVGRAGLAAHRRGTQQADIIKTTNNPRRRG